MSKLIVKPKQCAGREEISGKFYCNYQFGPRYCSWTDEFPASCPLKDGISTKEVFSLTAKARSNSKQVTKLSFDEFKKHIGEALDDLIEEKHEEILDSNDLLL